MHSRNTGTAVGSCFCYMNACMPRKDLLDVAEGKEGTDE